MAQARVTALNGNIPEVILVAIPGYDTDGTAHMTNKWAAESYQRLSAAYRNVFRVGLLPSTGYSCYRTRVDQGKMRAMGLTTIPVGQSIHGEALAVDFADLGGFGTGRHNWMKANAGAYGWYQPSWAKQYGSLPEYWHWEYDPDADQHTNDTPEEEDDMYTDADRARDRETHDAIGAGGATNLAEALSVLGRLIDIQSQVNGLPAALTSIKGDTAGVPDVLGVIRGEIVSSRDAVLAEIAVLESRIAELKALDTEIAGVLYLGTGGTPVKETVFQKVTRTATKVGA